MNTGLLPTKPDWRDRRFRTDRVFGAPSLDIPQSYDVERSTGNVTGDRNQGTTQFCAAYASSELQSDEFREPMDENYQVAMIGRVARQPITRGADLRDAMKALALYGSLPRKYADHEWQREGEEYVADWTRWDRKYETLAAPYRRTGYFSVSGPYDAFDNLRSTLYAHSPNNDIILGTPWYQSFSNLGDGNVIRRVTGGYTWHAFIVKGWRKSGSEHLLKVKSWSPVNGSYYFWMTREVVNQILGNTLSVAFMAKDTPASLTEALKEERVSLLEIALDYAKTLYWQLITRL